MEYQGVLLENLDAHQLEGIISVALLHIIQQFLHQPEKAIEPFCLAVTSLTCGLFQLVLPVEEGLQDRATSIPANAIGFSVRLHGHCYGTLYCLSPELAPANIPLNIGTSIAANCAICLYLLESAAFNQQRVERLDCHVPEKLTKRQRKILVLICQKYSDEDIAGELSIAPSTANKHRQTIYQLLNVHTSDDAAFVAFRHRLFSPLGLDLTEQLDVRQRGRKAKVR
jgi:DNA-binding CsgD family transcriptional regulator